MLFDIISIILYKICIMKLNTTIYLPEDLKHNLKVQAAKDGITMNAAIISAIMSYLKSKNHG